MVLSSSFNMSESDSSAVCNLDAGSVDAMFADAPPRVICQPTFFVRTDADEEDVPSSSQQYIEHLSNSPLDLSLHFTDIFSVHERAKTAGQFVGERLPRYGWAIIDNFVGKPFALAALHTVQQLYHNETFNEGRLVLDARGTESAEIRSDRILWWDKSMLNTKAVAHLVSMMDVAVFSASSALYPFKLGGKSRAMVACYPGHRTKYVRHVDNPDQDGRLITAIYYFNSDWHAEYGGCLKLYPTNCTHPINVWPVMDRLLLFWSDVRIPHEVLPANRERFALTVWYYDLEEKMRHLQKLGIQQQQPPSNQQTPTVHPVTFDSTSPSMSCPRINDMSATERHNDVVQTSHSVQSPRPMMHRVESTVPVNAQRPFASNNEMTGLAQNNDDDPSGVGGFTPNFSDGSGNNRNQRSPRANFDGQ